MRAKITQEEYVEQERLFLAILVETKNAYELLLSEGEDKLGTLAIAVPQPAKLVGSSLSSVLLGDRNIIIARSLAELLSQKTKKISLVSIFTKSVNEYEAAPIFKKLMDKVLKKSETLS